MSYAEALSISWALTWRLALAHIVLLLILATLLIAFGTPHNGVSAIAFYALCVLLEWLLAWPFVVKRALAPQLILPKLNPNADAGRVRVRYWVAVILGIVADLATLAPVAATVLLLHLSGIPIAIFFLLIRMFATLPIGIQALARQLGEVS